MTMKMTKALFASAAAATAAGPDGAGMLYEIFAK